MTALGKVVCRARGSGSGRTKVPICDDGGDPLCANVYVGWFVWKHAMNRRSAT